MGPTCIILDTKAEEKNEILYCYHYPPAGGVVVQEIQRIGLLFLGMRDLIQQVTNEQLSGVSFLNTATPRSDDAHHYNLIGHRSHEMPHLEMILTYCIDFLNFMYNNIEKVNFQQQSTTIDSILLRIFGDMLEQNQTSLFYSMFDQELPQVVLGEALRVQLSEAFDRLTAQCGTQFKKVLGNYGACGSVFAVVGASFHCKNGLLIKRQMPVDACRMVSQWLEIHLFDKTKGGTPAESLITFYPWYKSKACICVGVVQEDFVACVLISINFVLANASEQYMVQKNVELLLAFNIRMVLQQLCALDILDRLHTGLMGHNISTTTAPPLALDPANSTKTPVYFLACNSGGGTLITPSGLPLPYPKLCDIVFKSCVHIKQQLAQTRDQNFGGIEEYGVRVQFQNDTYWIVGRKIAQSDSSACELYVCFNDAIPQSTAEVAYKLAFGNIL